MIELEQDTLQGAVLELDEEHQEEEKEEEEEGGNIPRGGILTKEEVEEKEGENGGVDTSQQEDIPTTYTTTDGRIASEPQHSTQTTIVVEEGFDRLLVWTQAPSSPVTPRSFVNSPHLPLRDDQPPKLTTLVWTQAPSSPVTPRSTVSSHHLPLLDDQPPKLTTNVTYTDARSLHLEERLAFEPVISDVDYSAWSGGPEGQDPTVRRRGPNLWNEYIHEEWSTTGGESVTVDGWQRTEGPRAVGIGGGSHGPVVWGVDEEIKLKYDTTTMFEGGAVNSNEVQVSNRGLSTTLTASKEGGNIPQLRTGESAGFSHVAGAEGEVIGHSGANRNNTQQVSLNQTEEEITNHEDVGPRGRSVDHDSRSHRDKTKGKSNSGKERQEHRNMSYTQKHDEQDVVRNEQEMGTRKDVRQDHISKKKQEMGTEDDVMQDISYEEDYRSREDGEIEKGGVQRHRAVEAEIGVESQQSDDRHAAVSSMDNRRGNSAVKSTVIHYWLANIVLMYWTIGGSLVGLLLANCLST